MLRATLTGSRSVFLLLRHITRTTILKGVVCSTLFLQLVQLLLTTFSAIIDWTELCSALGSDEGTCSLVGSCKTIFGNASCHIEVSSLQLQLDRVLVVWLLLEASWRTVKGQVRVVNPSLSFIEYGSVSLSFLFCRSIIYL